MRKEAVYYGPRCLSERVSVCCAVCLFEFDLLSPLTEKFVCTIFNLDAIFVFHKFFFRFQKNFNQEKPFGFFSFTEQQ